MYSPRMEGGREGVIERGGDRHVHLLGGPQQLLLLSHSMLVKELTDFVLFFCQ